MHIKPMYGEDMHDPVGIKSLLGVHAWVIWVLPTVAASNA